MIAYCSNFLKILSLHKFARFPIFTTLTYSVAHKISPLRSGRLPSTALNFASLYNFLHDRRLKLKWEVGQPDNWSQWGLRFCDYADIIQLMNY